jgi:hypothetical protein
MKGYALKKWESTLNLYVHAHGNNVDPIMEAPCNNSYPLDIIPSRTCVESLATMELTMIVLL